MISFEILLIFACLVGAAFFAGIETGVISLPRVRLRHLVEQGDRMAAILQDFLLHPDKLLGTTLVGVNVCVTTASVLAAKLVHDLMGAWGEALASAVMTAIVLVFAEYLPKAWFQSASLRRTRAFAPLLRACYVVLLPAIRVVNGLTQWIIRGTGTEHFSTALVGTKDALDMFAKEGEEHGVLTPKQRIMIRRVIDLSGRTARQVMVPRAQVEWLSSKATVADFLEKARQAKHTRVPVYDEERKRFVGVVNLFDALSAGVAPTATVTDLMRLPLFVAETTPLTEILPRLRLSKQPVCLVTDSRAEVIGLLTTQDLIRAIVGQE